jgi:hypothetical protein
LTSLTKSFVIGRWGQSLHFSVANLWVSIFYIPPHPALKERMMIDGQLRAAHDGRTSANEHPASGRIIGEVADGSTADMGAAIGPAAGHATT